MVKIYAKIRLFSVLIVFSSFFNNYLYSQCNNTSAFGTITAPASGSCATISFAWAGDRHTVNSVVAATNYTVSSSVATDWFTVRQGTAAGPVIAFGQSPLAWTSTVAGQYFIHTNTNSSCGTQSSSRTVTVCRPSAPAPCIQPTAFTTVNAPTNATPLTISTCTFAGNFNTINSVVSGRTYQFSSSIATDWLTLTDGSNNVLVFGTTPISWTANFSGTVRLHVSTGSNCGTQTSCRTTTVTCTSCTPPPAGACIQTSAFATVSAPTNSTPITISSCTFAGNFNTINSVVSGQTYQFSSSIATDWLTLTDGTNNALVFGTTPISWTANFSGTVRLHVSTGSNCGTQSSCRTTTVTCTSCASPTCANSVAFGTAAAPTNNVPLTISTCTFQTEYNTITGVAAGSTYQSSYSLGGFITVRSGTFNGPVVASGNSPLTWTATVAGNHFIHYNTNSSCGTASSCGITTITCTSCPAPPPGPCIQPTASTTVAAPTNSTPLTISTCTFAGNFNTINSVVSGQTYQFSSGVATDWLTLTDGLNNALVVGTTPITWTANFSGAVRLHVSTGSNCGTQSSCRTTTVTCTSCPAPFNPCTSIPNISACGSSVSTNWTAGQSGAWNPISGSCGYATPGQERIWTFTPTQSGIHQINVTAISGGFVNFFWKAASTGCSNSGWTCIQDVFSVSTFGSLNLTAGVEYYILVDPEHNATGALTFNVTCPSTCSGTEVTLTMQDNFGDGWNGAELRLIDSQGNIFGPYTLNSGSFGQETICLPDECYRVVVTETFLNAYDDEISWSITSGATTFASAFAPFGAPQNVLFTIGSGACPPPPANDLCTNGVFMDLGVNPSQSHTGTGVGSTNTIGVTPYSQTWLELLVPCGGMNITIDFCGSSSPRTNAYIHLLQDCSSDPGLVLANNWNLTSCPNGNVTLNWLNVPAGTYYYHILIDNIQWPGAYTVNVTGSSVFTPATAPTTISGNTSICQNETTNLTVSGGTLGTNGTAQWYADACGLSPIGSGNTLTVVPNNSTTYYVRYETACNVTACQEITVDVNTASTAPAIQPISNAICPSTNTTLIASGGTAGTGSDIFWYTGPMGTGNLVGNGPSLVVAPDLTTLYYARREGLCNTTDDALINVQVKSFVYAFNGESSSNYCTDNDGWHHFFSGDDIIFSLQGDIATLPIGLPVASVFDNGAYYYENQGPANPEDCASNQQPGEQRFEMERSWNVNFGQGPTIGTYNVRFYYRPEELQSIIAASDLWMSQYPDCGFVSSGVNWFKNADDNYAAPQFQGINLNASIANTTSGITYAEFTGITSFSGGSAAIILTPDAQLPVKLTNFSAQCQEEKINITWSTASELNASHYILQSSRDGQTWLHLAEIDAAGTTNQTSNYSYIDQNFGTLTYYRLVQVDNDGQQEIFGPISSNCSLDLNMMTVHPNPTSENFTVLIQTAESFENAVVELLDMSGRVVMSQTTNISEGSTLLNFDGKALHAGTYMLRVKDQNDKFTPIRVVRM